MTHVSHNKKATDGIPFVLGKQMNKSIRMSHVALTLVNIAIIICI